MRPIVIEARQRFGLFVGPGGDLGADPPPSSPLSTVVGVAAVAPGGHGWQALVVVGRLNGLVVGVGLPLQEGRQVRPGELGGSVQDSTRDGDLPILPGLGGGGGQLRDGQEPPKGLGEPLAIHLALLPGGKKGLATLPTGRHRSPDAAGDPTAG